MLIKQPFNNNFCIIIDGLTTKDEGHSHTQLVAGGYYEMMKIMHHIWVVIDT